MINIKTNKKSKKKIINSQDPGGLGSEESRRILQIPNQIEQQIDENGNAEGMEEELKGSREEGE